MPNKKHNKDQTEFSSLEEELDWIHAELKRIYPFHGKARYDYEKQRKEFTLGVIEWMKEHGGSHAAAERDFMSTNEGEFLYSGYKDNKAQAEGLDANLRNLDARRMIIQSKLKKESN